MAIGFVSKSVTALSSSGTTTVITTPASIAVGHRMVAVLWAVGASTTITGPAGWTKLAEFAPNTNLKSALYYRDVDGSETGTYTWTWSVSGRSAGHIVAYSGCDLTGPPVYAVSQGTEDSPGPHAAPAVAVPDNGWLITAVGARQSPGTAGQVPWSINVGGDTERNDATATNVGTGAQVPSAFYDSNAPLTASVGAPTMAPAPVTKYNDLWSGSGAMRVGATMKIDELEYWRPRLSGLDWMRIFPNDDGMPPAWTDPRFGFCQDFGAEPFISTKLDGNLTLIGKPSDSASKATLRNRLIAMPAWITRLWITDRHEPEGDVTPAAYIANYKALWTMVAGLPPAVRARIKCGPVLTRQWTENTAGRTYKTHDPGPGFGDFFGVDMYMNSYKSGNTAATEFVNPTTFLSKVKAYRYDGKSAATTADTRPRIFPELGAIGIPDDTDGTDRATWMQGVQDQLVAWSQTEQGWPMHGWIWWNAEGKSGDSVLRIGTRRWFNLDRIHNSEPYTYTKKVDGKVVTVTDPIGGYDDLPNITTGGGGGAVPTARQVTSSAQTAFAHVWAVALASAAGGTPTSNPWTSCGVPL